MTAPTQHPGGGRTVAQAERDLADAREFLAAYSHKCLAPLIRELEAARQREGTPPTPLGRQDARTTPTTTPSEPR